MDLMSHINVEMSKYGYAATDFLTAFCRKSLSHIEVCRFAVVRRYK
jgi:hypothetical protein